MAFKKQTGGLQSITRSGAWRLGMAGGLKSLNA
jgi:hypothetical protein